MYGMNGLYFGNKKGMTMNGEKIVITTVECDNATPVPSCATYSLPPLTEQEVEEGKTLPRFTKGVAIAVLVVAFVFVAIGMVSYCVLQNSKLSSEHIVEQQTVDQFKDYFVQKTNAELANPESGLRKYIENAHLTVSVSKAYVKDCAVTTIDGSDLVGVDFSNLDEISLTIRFYWDGIVDRDGHTDLKLTYDVRAEKVENAEIGETTAKIDITDPKFWFGVGEALALCFL